MRDNRVQLLTELQAGLDSASDAEAVKWEVGDDFGERNNGDRVDFISSNI